MPKLKVILLIIAICVTVVLPLSTEKLGRSLFVVKNKVGFWWRCGFRPCPPWKCQDDSAVIHGYCCHCPGSEYDNVPVICPWNLVCPPPEPLCSDYDFMMDCCCTGP